MIKFKPGVILLLEIFFCVSAFEIKLQDDGPIVRGGKIRFAVEVYDEKGLAKDQLRFEWHDGAIPQHMRESPITTTGTDVWEVTYNASIYPAGAYITQVIIYKCTWFNICYQDGSARIEFDITENLNGNLLLQQKNKSMSNYVSTKEELVHVIELKKTDMDFIKTAPAVRTYWFVDCTYYGITTEMRFKLNFTSPDKDHLVEALVMADFKPPVPTTTVPPSTTTTPTTTTSSTSPSTTSTPTTKKPTSKTTTKPHSITSPSSLKLIKRYADASPQSQSSNIKIWNNGSLVPYNVSFPFVCNSSYISTDSDKIYGFFSRKFETKDPLTNINITGNNWIQPGDLLSLRVRCNGSKNFKYCVDYKKGEYNVTGNETCDTYQQVDKCDFSIRRYLFYPNPKYTIIVIIQNDVSKEIMPITVNIYKVQKQGQLSVVVVPVAFSLVAVVLIVFGIAYYFQNRSRFIIEVADFNFGQQYADMEYKTFRERLRDSLANAFTRTPTPSSSEVPVWPPGRKYGSMT